MIRAQRAAAYFDDEDNEGSAVPTWIMGIPYTELGEEERRLDVFSTMWITYRSGFPRMEPYGYTDDSGWGCMLRSAQMLMTQALQRHLLGRFWRVPRTLEERLRVPEYRTLVRLFADNPGEDSLFSIHNMCQVGIRYDKLPGEWYGPTTAACVLRDISELYAARISSQPRCPSPPPSPPPPPPPSSSSPPPSSSQPASVEDEDCAPAEGDTYMSREAGGGPEARDGAPGGADVERREGDDQEAGEMDSLLPPVNGVGAVTSGNGDANATGKDVQASRGVFPSSRPLRVFVSQGDVVYIDEVEAMAIRKGGDVAGEEGDVSGKVDGGIGGVANSQDLSSELQISSNGRFAGKGTVPLGSDPLACENMAEDVDKDPGEGGGGSSPAFFDPLLNPGSARERSRDEEAWSSAVVLLIPLRLGLDELSTGYIPSLLEMLRVPQSLGFLGGRPNHAIFFIGAQGNTLTGLDPHTTQAAPDMTSGFPSERYAHSLHCQSAVSMDVNRIDPSLALAFYLPDRAAFQDLIEKIGETNPPPFSVEQTRPDYEGEMGLAFMINQRDDDGTTDDDDDEYVFVKGPER